MAFHFRQANASRAGRGFCPVLLIMLGVASRSLEAAIADKQRKPLLATLGVRLRGHRATAVDDPLEADKDGLLLYAVCRIGVKGLGDLGNARISIAWFATGAFERQPIGVEIRFEDLAEQLGNGEPERALPRPLQT